MAGLEQDREILARTNRLAVDGKDVVGSKRNPQVAHSAYTLGASQSHEMRRTTTDDIDDENTTSAGRANSVSIQARGEVGADIHQPDAEPRMRVTTVGDELGHDAGERLGGDGEANPRGRSARTDDGGVQPDDTAFEIEKRSTGVTGIDGSIRLDDLTDETSVRALNDPTERANDA